MKVFVSIAKPLMKVEMQQRFGKIERVIYCGVSRKKTKINLSHGQSQHHEK